MPDLRSGSSTSGVHTNSTNENFSEPNPSNPPRRNAPFTDNPQRNSPGDQNQNSSFQSTISHTDANRYVASTTALDTLISSVVNRVLETKIPSIVNNCLSPNCDNFAGTDQAIAGEYRNRLDDMDRIPDVARCLRQFSGDPGEFSSWKKSAERILDVYEPLKGTPKYYGILSVIRKKIVGNADIALESYNTPLNWKSISR